jgi:hypothetical protein
MKHQNVHMETCLSTKTPKDDTPCLSCQYEATWKATGHFPSPQAETHWSRWGCTCDPDTAADALDYMRKVTQ